MNNILREGLKQLSPAAGWLSEENIDNKDRLSKEQVWITDPIDGTSAFTKGQPQFSLSVALVEACFPILGGVALPIDQLIVIGNSTEIAVWQYSSPRQSSALLNTVEGGEQQEESAEKWQWKRRPACLSNCNQLEKARILVSPTEWKRGELVALSGQFQCIPEGSIARKLALVAMGEGDLVVSVRPKNEWDIAGGAALILNQEQGWMTDLAQLRQQTFNNEETISYGLVAGSRQLVEQFQAFWRQKSLKNFYNFS